MSQVFISHSTKDKAIALQVLERLREQGYQSLFLDSDPEAGIKAGAEWERDLYRNLKLAAAVVVLSQSRLDGFSLVLCRDHPGEGTR